MYYIGDFLEDATVYVMFNTFTSDDPSASSTITNFINTDVHIHKDDGLTQRNNAAGITVSVDFDGITGSHMIKIDTSDNTVAGFWVTGSDYFVRIEGTTVDGATINAVVAHFSIQNRYMRGTDSAALASVCTEARLAELAAANLPADIAAIPTTPALASVCTEARLAELDAAKLPTDIAAISLVVPDAAGIAATPAEVATALTNYAGPTKAEMDTAHGLLATEAKQDVSDASIATILADLINDGRLDVLIDAIKAKTDNIPASPAPSSEYDTEMGRITGNVALASVVGALADAAAVGEVTEADTLVQYLKQLINILIGTPGIATFPAEQAPANAVNLAEVIRAIHADVTGLNGDVMVGTDGANTTEPDAAGVAAGLHTTTDGLVTTVDTVVDGIVTDVAAVKAETALIVEDTSELQTDDYSTSIAAIQTEVDKIGIIPALDSAAQTIGAAIGKLADDNAGANFDSTSHSLKKIRERGDAAWTSGAASALATTVAVGNSTTVFTLTDGSPTIDAYNDMQITVTDGDGNGETITKRISDYSVTTKQITVDSPFPFTPAAGDVAIIERAYLGVSVSGGDATEAKQDTIVELLDTEIADIATLLGVSGGGTVEWKYEVLDGNSDPIADVLVEAKVSGVLVQSKRTDVLGIATFNLMPGTYDFYSTKSGYNFTNPDTEVVS